MLFHLSIPAREPKIVAEALAELWRGYAIPFPIYEGGWIAFALDERNTAVEVVPHGLALKPNGAHGSQADAGPAPAVHIAIASPLSPAEVIEVARQHGWPAMRCSRAGFDVMEVWLEGEQMIEVLTPEMQKAYLSLDVAAFCGFLGFPSPPKRKPVPA